MKPLNSEAKRILDNAPRWRPIDSAPKDGSKIVVGIEWRGGMLCGFAWWTDNRWEVEPFRRPWPLPFIAEKPVRELTHWLPLEEGEGIASDEDRLQKLIWQMRSVAGPVGPMHGWWDMISDYEALLRGEPMLVKRSIVEAIKEGTEMLQSVGISPDEISTNQRLTR